MDALMARAQAEGRMRAGVDSRDVRDAVRRRRRRCCAPRATATRPTWRRYAGLVADAMRA